MHTCPGRASYVPFPFVSPVTPPAPAERLTVIIALLCRAVAARGAGGWLGGVSVILVWSRLRRLASRFVRLAARLEAGTKPAPPRPAAPRPKRPKPPHRLPRGHAWLVRLVPEAASGASQLQHLLAEPEMAALIAATPQMGRLLRPLCRMLGVAPPPAIAKPPPVTGASPSRPAAVRAPRASPPAPRPRPRRTSSGLVALPAACGPPVPA